ncbi:MAG: SGNH/GDSL hydrolase family protein, partial [Lentimonas sp.]
MNKLLLQILCGVLLLLIASTAHGTDSLASKEELYMGKEYANARTNPKDTDLPNVLLVGDSISIGYTVDARKL